METINGNPIVTTLILGKALRVMCLTRSTKVITSQNVYQNLSTNSLLSKGLQVNNSILINPMFLMSYGLLLTTPSVTFGVKTTVRGSTVSDSKKVSAVSGAPPCFGRNNVT